MVGDLYQAMKKRQRKYFAVIDGVIAGEGQGPFCPTSKFTNTIIAGDDLLATDIATVRYMGLNPEKIKYLRYFIEKQYEGISMETIDVIENGELQKNFFYKKTNYLDFNVVEQWKEVKYI